MKTSLYSVHAAPFIQTLRTSAEENRSKIAEWYGEPVARCEALLDAYHAFACQHTWVFLMERQRPTATQQIVFSAIHKGQTALFAALELLRSGFFGSGRPLLRQVFEAQILAKFAAVRADNVLATQWVNGDNVSIGRSVFPKILQPAPDPLKDFWKILCQFVHATPSSQQMSPFASDNQEAVGVDVMLLTLLLHNQYHLLRRHTFTSVEKYYVSRYAPQGELSRIRQRIDDLQKANVRAFSPDGKAFVRAFRASWILRP
jgi:hypothetical protein